MPLITHERLLEVLAYESDTGFFRWKVRASNRNHIGDRAGVRTSTGHRFISVDREKLQASRLAWFYVHGEWPKGDIKFLNENPEDCSINNLRDVSKIELARLRGALSTNTTGYRGVSPRKKGGFQASVTGNYQQVNLGVFETAEEASAAYEHAMAILSPAKTPEDCEKALDEIVQNRRQRVAWARLVRSGRHHDWTDFETFCVDIGRMEDDEATVAAKDEARPIGKDNFRFLAKIDGKFDRSTKEGQAAYMRAYREANPDRYRHAHLKNNYGLSEIDIERMRKEQNNKCAMCGQEETRVKVNGDTPRRLSLDHCHKTKEPRALLCAQCNWAMGQFGDDLERLRLAVTYLENYPKRTVPFVCDDPNRDWLLVATRGHPMN